MRRRLPVLSGLALLIAGGVVFVRTDDLLPILPDRAKLQGFVGLPLVLAAPGLMSLGLRPPTARMTLRFVVLAAVGIAIALAVTLLGSITQIGCRPITSPLEALPQVVLLAGIPAIGFVVAARSARPTASADVAGLRSIFVGAVILLAALALDVGAFAVLFPPLSCAPPL